MPTSFQPDIKEVSLEFGRLINSAFTLSWRYKSLWVFGFFAGFGANTQFDFSPAPQNSEMQEYLSNIENLSVDQIIAFVGTTLLFVIVLGLIFFITSLIASPAMVDAVNKISRGGIYRFSDSFSIGVDFFWRFFGLALLGFVGFVAFALIVLMFGAISFAISKVLGGVSLLVLIPVFLVGLFGIFNIFEIAKRAMVVRQGTIFDALEEGYLLLRSNLGDFFMFFLINFGMIIGFAIAVMIVSGLFAIPVAMISFGSDTSMMSRILMGVLIGFPFSIVVGGWTATFFHSLYTLFYFELVEPPQVALDSTATITS